MNMDSKVFAKTRLSRILKFSIKQDDFYFFRGEEAFLKGREQCTGWKYIYVKLFDILTKIV